MLTTGPVEARYIIIMNIPFVTLALSITAMFDGDVTSYRYRTYIK